LKSFVLVAGHDRQPVEIGAHRLIGAIEPRSQVDGLLEISSAMMGAPGARTMPLLRFRARKTHDDRGFCPSTNAVRLVIVGVEPVRIGVLRRP
jgi:hypothetical protein